MLKAYVECALWSSPLPDEGDCSPPMDKRFGPEDLAWETIIAAAIDCEDFMHVLDGETFTADDLAEMADDERMGHCLWLTRNGHGVGFWDGRYPRMGARLTRIAKAMGPCEFYVGDDGKIYMHFSAQRFAFGKESL